MDISVLPSPLRHFLAQLDEVRSVGILDMDQVGRVLVELAADEEYLGPLIAEIPPESPGGKWLVKPERGPRLVLFHRPEGDALRHEGGQAELRLADERARSSNSG